MRDVRRPTLLLLKVIATALVLIAFVVSVPVSAKDNQRTESGDASTRTPYENTIPSETSPQTAAQNSSTTATTLVQESDRQHQRYGDWGYFYDPNLSDQYGSVGQSVANFDFRGTNVTWKTMKAPSGGIVDIYLDGTQVATFDLYSASKEYNVTGFSKKGLSKGSHTLTLVLSGKNPSSTGPLTFIDKFKVGRKTYQDNSYAITYAGFSGAKSTQASGGAYRENNFVSSNAVQFGYFTGPEVDFITAKGPSFGHVRVAVYEASVTNAAYQDTLDLSAPTNQWQVKESITGLDLSKSYTLVLQSDDFPAKPWVIDAYAGTLAGGSLLYTV